MQDLMEMELEGFVGSLLPRFAPARAAQLHRQAQRRRRVAAIARTRLTSALAGPLAPVLDRAARRRLAAQGEQIDMAGVAAKLRDYKHRLLNFLASPAVIKVVEATARDTHTTPTAFVLKSAVRFAVEKAREKGWLSPAEGEAINKLAPKAIEKALPGIVEAIRQIGDGESGDLLEAEMELLA